MSSLPHSKWYITAYWFSFEVLGMRGMDRLVSSAAILIVDDSLEIVRLLASTLQQAGYSISVATDGTQAFAKAVAAKPDLILLDVHLPGMNGLSIARRLKQIPETNNIPVLFMSSAISPEERLSGLRAGGSDYISKPFRAEEVLERVRIHLSLSRNATHLPEASIAAGKANLDQQALYQASTRFISDHLDTPPTSRDLAALLSTSERKIIEAFAVCSGMTVSAYCRKAAMERAAKLLQQTSIPVAVIADELGYSSAANFATAVKDYFGQTPSQIRKKGKRD